MQLAAYHPDMKRLQTAVVVFSAAGLLLAPVHGQNRQRGGQPSKAPPAIQDEGDDGELVITSRSYEPDAEMRALYREQQRTRSEMERELRRLRGDHFRSIRNVQIRQAGIAKMRQYTDPVIYPSLIEIFAREGDDVRGAVLDHLVDQQNDDADTVLAWTAVFDKDKNYRLLATERLKHRSLQAGEPTLRIKSVVAEGLRRSRDEEVAAAAQVAHALHLAEAIPMLINSQVVMRGTGSTSGSETSLAWILVGQQQAFVADVRPVVGHNAVAFDPQLAVVTTGTVLRVIDAAVVTYRMDVHHSLVGLTSELWGQSTAHLGFDGPAWAAWYLNEFRPYWAAVEAERLAKEKADLERSESAGLESESAAEPAEKAGGASGGG